MTPSCFLKSNTFSSVCSSTSQSPRVQYLRLAKLNDRSRCEKEGCCVTCLLHLGFIASFNSSLKLSFFMKTLIPSLIYHSPLQLRSQSDNFFPPAGQLCHQNIPAFWRATSQRFCWCKSEWARIGRSRPGRGYMILALLLLILPALIPPISSLFLSLPSPFCHFSPALRN